MDVGLILLLAAVLLLQLVTAQDTCTQQGHCSCKFADGTQISLKDLANSDGKPRFDFVKATTSTYLYAYNPCNPFSFKGPCIDVAACQESADGKNIFNLGDVNSATFNADGTVITYQATVDDTKRTTAVHLECDQQAVQPTFSATDRPGSDNYNFNLKTCLACRSGCPSSLSGGSVVCLLFSIVVILYFVVGVLFLKFVRGAEGKELIPNYEFWKDLPFLIKDGVLFVARGCKSEPDNYEQI